MEAAIVTFEEEVFLLSLHAPLLFVEVAVGALVVAVPEVEVPLVVEPFVGEEEEEEPETKAAMGGPGKV